MMLAESCLRGPDYFIVVGYFTLMVAIGVYFYRRMRQMKDFFSGGNRVPWWLSGVSFYMTSFSAFTFVTYSALAYQYGWVAVTLFWVTIPATLVSVIFFSARWRRARIVSPVEYLESRYSPVVRQLFAWQGIPVRIIDDGLKLVATGAFISEGLGMDRSRGILYSGLIMLGYTLMGGLWAVVVTDFIQFIVMASAVAVLVPLSLYAAGGVGQFVSNAPPGFFSLTHENYGWGYLLSNLLMFTVVYSGTQWALIQKYYCVPTETDAKKVGYLVAGLYLIGTPLMFLPAMAARYFLHDLTDTNQVYPMLCTYLLPAGLMGLVIAAMFSATMSTLSGEYNVCAGVLTNDVYRRLVRPKASEKELVLVGRLMTLLVGVLALAVAFGLGGSKGDRLWRNMIALFSVATAPVGVPMLLGLIWRRTTNLSALAGFGAGIVCGLLVMYFGPNEMMILGTILKNENLVLFSSLFMTSVTVVMVALFRPAAAAEVNRIEAFHTRLDLPIGRLPEDFEGAVGDLGSRESFSPFRIVGALVVLVGLMLLGVSPFIGQANALAMNAAVGLALLCGGAVMIRQSRRKVLEPCVRSESESSAPGSWGQPTRRPSPGT